MTSLTCLIGGLGKSQCGAIIDAMIPSTLTDSIWYPSEESNQYQVELGSIMLGIPSDINLIFAHSFACETAVNAANELIANGKTVSLLVLLDAVRYTGNGQPLIIPKEVKQCVDIKAATTIGIVRSTVAGVQVAHRVESDYSHNTLPNSAAIVAELCQMRIDCLVAAKVVPSE